MSHADPVHLPEPLPAYDFDAERLEADAADMANDAEAVERSGPLHPLPWKADWCGVVTCADGRPVAMFRFTNDAEWLVNMVNRQHQAKEPK